MTSVADDNLEHIDIAFLSTAMPDAEIRLRGLWGREELSRLFELRLLLEHDRPLSPDEIDALLDNHCCVAMGPGDHDTMHGILKSILLLDSTRQVRARYIATLVPTVSILDLTRHCRIFQHHSTSEIITTLLESCGLESGADFELRLNGGLPKREHVVQYQESDWAFLQRWMEHDGLFYWFEHGAGGDRLIIADANDDGSPIAAPNAISYRERNNLTTGGASTIWDWQLEQRRTPGCVAVLDYNYRMPHVPLAEVADVSGGGFGSVVYYGAHFKSEAEGKRIAKIRAEQLAARRRTVSGTTNCARFRVGHTFALENHHDAQHDGSYLITAIDHAVGHVVDDARRPAAADADAPQRYFARFDALSKSVPFRAERLTRWPKIEGIMHAHIAGDSSGDVAEIDSVGRYKVKFPWDIFGPEGSATSRPIRMAQPYAGANYGTHFPLHRGAEVLLAHIGGDPDRPVIIAAVPNAHTVSPSTGANATQSVIQSASGIRIKMEDRA